MASFKIGDKFYLADNPDKIYTYPGDHIEVWLEEARASITRRPIKLND